MNIPLSIHRILTGSLLALTLLGLCHPGADALKMSIADQPAYGKIVASGKGQGLGRVIGPVSQGWEMVCFEDGLCINLLDTGEPTETDNPLGSGKVKLMAYTLREAAAQLNHVAAVPNSAIIPVLGLAETGSELGRAMSALEQCRVTAGCDVGEIYQAMIDPGYRNFVRAHRRYHRYLKQHPDVFGAVPEVPRLVDYQAHGIADIIESIAVVYDPIANRMRLQTQAQLYPQTGRELCGAVAGQSACRLLLPR